MADVKISALPLATTPLAGTEVLPIVQSNVTAQVSVANLTAGRSIAASELTCSNLLVGTSSSNGQITSRYDGLTKIGMSFDDTSTTGTTQAIVFRKLTSTQVGSIQTSTTATSYVTASDYRLKENVQPMTDGLATVSALKPVRYDWVSDKSAGEGFIAHELQFVIPLAVTGKKDAVNADGSINPQGVDYSKIVVHLVAAVQELKAEFDAYKAAHP